MLIAHTVVAVEVMRAAQAYVDLIDAMMGHDSHADWFAEDRAVLKRLQTALDYASDSCGHTSCGLIVNCAIEKARTWENAEFAYWREFVD